MSKVLYITANPKPTSQSYGLSVGQAFLEAYRHEAPDHEIINLDLYKMNIPHIDADVLNGWGKLQKGMEFESLTAEEKSKIGAINKLADQFVEADKYIFVTPMWNFSFPPLMKAYIDTICIAGKTFKYTEEGPVGLLSGKRAVHIQARGGIYSEGPAVEKEFGDRYLRAIMDFVGIENVDSIVVEGMNQMPNEAESIKEKAMARAREIVKDFAE